MPGGGLQREIKKRQPFDSLEQEAMLNLLRTNDLLHIRFTRLFRRHGITPSQYNILRILRGEGMPLPCLDIAARLVAVVPGITGLIDRLETLGLVKRARCEVDRRVIHVAATPKALGLLSRLDEPVLTLHKELVGHMSRRELKELIRLLEKARRRATEEGDHD
ncbi:MAG TPA: MarR family transcriptional regulator [Isosphaeraceae bacterium]|jgi:DNA-binding MarR family transcriptional regulator|nr:MarR family transcriptional regulator [Isosphaeraceae bacterium]